MVNRPLLTQQARELLLEAVTRQRPDLRPVLEEGLAGRTLSAEEANEIREAIGDELMATGIDTEVGAVNERGEQLDDLIDYVSRISSVFDD